MTNNALMELAQSKEYDKTLDVYQQQPIEAIAEVADYLRNEDVYNVAMAMYQYLLQQKDSADFHYGIGQCYGKIYDYKTSLSHLQRAFTPGSNRTEGANYYAYILERNQLMPQAYEWYQKALESGYDEDLWTLSHYAYFLEKYNKKEEASQAYKNVLDKNPAYTWAVKRYALFLLKENEPDLSMQVMQTALEKFPKNPFVKLNYLEYLIIRGIENEYDEYLQSLDYANSPLPFKVLVDLFDYFFKYLLNGKSDTVKVKAYEEKAKGLQDSIHRDFDDLNELLESRNGDMSEWKRLIQFLLK